MENLKRISAAFVVFGLFVAFASAQCVDGNCSGYSQAVQVTQCGPDGCGTVSQPLQVGQIQYQQINQMQRTPFNVSYPINYQAQPVRQVVRYAPQRARVVQQYARPIQVVRYAQPIVKYVRPVQQQPQWQPGYMMRRVFGW